MGMAPGGHAGETDAVSDDVVEMANGQILGLRGAQIWTFRIEVAAYLGQGPPPSLPWQMAQRSAKATRARASLRVVSVGFQGFLASRTRLGMEILRTVRATTFSREEG